MFSSLHNDQTIVAVRFFESETAARLFAARLQQENIPCFLSNANMASVLPLQNTSVGLHVKAEDQVEAARLIARLEAEMEQSPDLSYREATKEDIIYLQTLKERQSKRFPAILGGSLLIMSALLLLRALFRALGWLDTSLAPF